jgi:carbamoylphosphate synthase large subunit
MAIKMMRSIGNFSGGCNVQFAVSDDEKEEIIAIEINPRLSWTVGVSCCDEGNKALGSSAGCTEHPAPLCQPINIGAYSAN